jgi:hypothetical protein
VVAVNDEDVFIRSLLASPDVDERCQILPQRGFTSAAEAYNHGLGQAQCEVVVFAHQDVYLPLGWWTAVEAAIQQLTSEWGVLGVYGIDAERCQRGFVYDTGFGGWLGEPLCGPRPVRTLDEIVLVVNRASGLRFDHGLPGFHFYGTDICLQAASRGLQAFAIPAICIHNSNRIIYFEKDFWDGYAYMQNKWRSSLPVTTPCTLLSSSPWPSIARRLRDLPRRLVGPARRATRVPEPQQEMSRALKALGRRSIRLE